MVQRGWSTNLGSEEGGGEMQRFGGLGRLVLALLRVFGFGLLFVGLVLEGGAARAVGGWQVTERGWGCLNRGWPRSWV